MRSILAILAIALLVGCGDTHEDHNTHENNHHANNPGNNASSDLVQVVDGWTLTMVPESTQYVVGPNDFNFTLEDPDGAVDPAEFLVEGWMPGHGHGTAVPTAITKTGAGQYTATVTFNMGGDWEIRVDADDRNFVFAIKVGM